jgi:hypothetical protein
MKFFHGSRFSQPVGKVLLARERPTIFSSKRDIRGLSVEDFVESMRPKKEISRLKCIFLAHSPERVFERVGGSDEYIYQCAPIGRVTKADFGWFSEILSLITPHVSRGRRTVPRTDFLLNKDALVFAMNYWHQVRHPESDDEHNWEYLAHAVKVVALVGTSHRVQIQSSGWKY